MQLFHPDSGSASAAHRRLYARFELAYTLADLAAAALFIIGSIMFFSEAWTTFGTWLFLTGSLLFGLKPTLRLVKEIKLYRMGNIEDLAERADANTPSSK